LVKAAIFLPPSMVERNLSGSNFLCFLAFTTADAMVGLLPRAENPQQGKKGERKCEVCGILQTARQKQWFHFSVAKVKDFAAHRDCSAVEPDGTTA
jgi:uncharacterized protein (DUF169 family)